MLRKFSHKTQEVLKFYVYILVDPRNNKIFYVGKGCENRVFDHISEAIENPIENEKLETIRAIKNNQQEVKHFIVRHGLGHNEALLVEAVLIDFLTFKDFYTIANITNILAGHYSFERGIKTVEECEILFNCQELKNEDIVHNILIININKTYDSGKIKNKKEHPIYDRPNIYEATRGWWVLNVEKAKTVDYVLAEYKGVIRAVFEPERWLQNDNRSGNRWGFKGKPVEDKNILDRYLNKEISKKKGASNPIQYCFKYNCES